MHILAAHYQSEFLATPQLVRFDDAEGHDGAEPTLLIKASTLLLKYIVQGVQIHLVFSRLGDRLLYALRVVDDEKKPAILWSILERDEEKVAIDALTRGESCQVFLFNELAVNVAWTTWSIDVNVDLAPIAASIHPGPADHSALHADAGAILDRLNDDLASDANLIAVDVQNKASWQPILSHFITSHAGSSPVDLFSSDEGGQQEQLAIWLTDGLHPLGVHHAPQIPKGSGFRELTDILLSYEYGSILIESKTLMLLQRQSLPDRTKLAHDVSHHIAKAIKQLCGAIRRLKGGAPVTDKAGQQLSVERSQPMHAIVLIPDLDLIEDRSAYDLQFIRQFMEATGAFIHLLDIAELLRIVQAAELISARGGKTTPIMAFDYYLMERANKTRDAGTLCIEVLLRITDD